MSIDTTHGQFKIQGRDPDRLFVVLGEACIEIEITNEAADLLVVAHHERAPHDGREICRISQDNATIKLWGEK